MQFLCDADMPQTTLPQTWTAALRLLKTDYTTNMVVQALADFLTYTIRIVTVHGVSTYIVLKNAPWPFTFGG